MRGKIDRWISKVIRLPDNPCRDGALCLHQNHYLLGLMSRLSKTLTAVFYSFPVQLFINNLKRNHLIIVSWIVLIAMVTGGMGKYLGIPYLFLDPEYLNNIGFASFFIMGVASGGFIAAFQITCYISDGHRFSFVGALSKPFTRFTLNNSILPLLFLGLYLDQLITFQINNEYSTRVQILETLAGFFAGLVLTAILFFAYIRFTTKDIFKYMVCRLDEKIKKGVGVSRASALRKLDIARKRQVRVDNHLDFRGRFLKVDQSSFYDRQTIIQVFDQNHFNLITIELLIFGFVLLLGIFKDNPYFQLPAAASFMIFLTIFVMITGAFSYWFGGWSETMALVIFLVLNYLVGENILEKKYEAFGLDYNRPPAAYTVDSLKGMADSTSMAQDRSHTVAILNRWKAKLDSTDGKPKMVFICVSGGGKRASLWTLNALQTADSLTGGRLMDHATLITGASGGLVGAGYFRELALRAKSGSEVDPYDGEHRNNISSDNLNPLIFSLLANDLFVGLTHFNYEGLRYQRNRAYTFEEQLNNMTGRLLDKPLSAYREPEEKALIPIMLLSPTVVNDGRKLYISAQPVSYLNYEVPFYSNSKISGVDFQKLFREHGGSQMRFLSALRMSATFPYITPNTTLPTRPVVEIMDAGISDNFGVSDAVRFLYNFRDWVSSNTSGVIILSIRDSKKLPEIAENEGQSLVDQITSPISTVYNNFENFQDISNDALVGNARSWLACPVYRVDVQYQAEEYVPILQKMDSIRQNNARASLSWRLTTREKLSVINNIWSDRNRAELKELVELLKPVSKPAER